MAALATASPSPSCRTRSIISSGCGRTVRVTLWPVLPLPQRMDTSFPVTVIARDANNNTIPTYTNSVSLSGSILLGVANNTILNGSGPSFTQNNGSYTYGYSFTPNVDLSVTAVRQYWTGIVSIWDDTGALLAA